MVIAFGGRTIETASFSDAHSFTAIDNRNGAKIDRPSPYCTDAGEHLVERKRLDQIIICALIETSDMIGDPSASPQNYNGDTRILGAHALNKNKPSPSGKVRSRRTKS